MTIATLFALALAVDLAPRPPPPGGAPDHARRETRCAACHTPEGWDRVTFDHARTGFALDGAHRAAPCRGCHREAADFRAPVPRACVACHRDVHAGRLGTRCHHCHDAVAWGEPTFGPEAHRRTDFPLDGRHAVLPCEECHGDVRDRSFSRPTRRCAACHEADLLRTAAQLDHQALGFPDDCRRCHGAWAFAPAYLTGHDACFPIRRGRHSGIRCLQCHPSLAASDFQSPGACSTAVPAACSRCHGTCPGGHTGCPISDNLCYQCHPTGSGEGGD